MRKKYIITLLGISLLTLTLAGCKGKKIEGMTVSGSSNLVQEVIKVDKEESTSESSSVEENEVIKNEDQVVGVNNTSAPEATTTEEKDESKGTLEEKVENKSQEETKVEETENKPAGEQTSEENKPIESAPVDTQQQENTPANVVTAESKLIEIYGSKQAAEEAYSNDDLKVSILGNTLSYSYTYPQDLTEDEKGVVGKEIKEAFKGLENDYIRTIKNLEKTTGINGVSMVVVYKDNKGNELARIDMNSNGIKE